jgi:DNA-binding CsgD family transcriptional regulator
MTREGYRWQSRPWRPSDIQARILDGVARGRTNAEIAAEIGMTLDGVKWHVSRALSETGLSDRQSLARWWQGGPLRMSLTGRNEQRAKSNEPRAHGSFVSLDYATSMRAMASSFAIADQRDPSWRRLTPSHGYMLGLLADEPISRPAE